MGRALRQRVDAAVAAARAPPQSRRFCRAPRQRDDDEAGVDIGRPRGAHRSLGGSAARAGRVWRARPGRAFPLEFGQFCVNTALLADRAGARCHVCMLVLVCVCVGTLVALLACKGWLGLLTMTYPPTQASLRSQAGQPLLDLSNGDGGESELASKLCDDWGCLRVLCDGFDPAWARRPLKSAPLMCLRLQAVATVTLAFYCIAVL